MKNLQKGSIEEVLEVYEGTSKEIDTVFRAWYLLTGRKL